MGYSRLPCDWCKVYDPCRFQWLDDKGLPCVFCSMRCMENYIFWQAAKQRRAQDKTKQDKTEQDSANGEYWQV